MPVPRKICPILQLWNHREGLVARGITPANRETRLKRIAQSLAPQRYKPPTVAEVMKGYRADHIAATDHLQEQVKPTLPVAAPSLQGTSFQRLQRRQQALNSSTESAANPVPPFCRLHHPRNTIGRIGKRPLTHYGLHIASEAKYTVHIRKLTRISTGKLMEYV